MTMHLGDCPDGLIQVRPSTVLADSVLVKVAVRARAR